MPYVIGSIDSESRLIDPPRMSWGAIFAGWLVAMGMACLLYVAGLALGFSALDTQHPAESARGAGIGTMVWVALTWTAALFVGGLFASWFDGRADQTMGSLHGVAVWGLSFAAAGLFFTVALSHAAHGHAHQGMRSSSPVMAARAASSHDDAIILRANVRHVLMAEGNRSAEPSDVDAMTAALMADHAETAQALLAANGMSSDAANEQVRTWEPLARTAREQAKQDAERWAHHLAMALWVAFASGALALLGAVLGGWLGSHHIHRVYHLRRYEGRPYREI